MEIAESIYEVDVEPSYKNVLGQMPTVLVSAGKLEENPPLQLITPRLVISLASTKKDMYIIQKENPN